MITKYIVGNDHIDFYEDDEIVCTLPNNEENLKLAKLFNNQVFIEDDIKNCSAASDYYNDYCKKGAKYSLICFVALVITSLLKFPLLNMLSFTLLAFNVIAFMISKDKLRNNDNRLSYLKRVKKDIEDKIEEIQNSKNKEKIANLQLTFTNEQIIDDHKRWLTECGYEYDYSHDVELIKTGKVLIKK